MLDKLFKRNTQDQEPSANEQGNAYAAAKPAAQSPEEHTNTVMGLMRCIECGKQYSADRRTCPDDGCLLIVSKQEQKHNPDHNRLVGTLFADRYNVESVLGEGGMSVVYRARHEMMDRTVAIKILKEFESSQERMLKRFQQEARAASSLTHHHLISLYDFGITAEGLAYIVMDYLEGQSMEAELEKNGRIEFNRLCKLFLQVCDGLQHAHEKGIIHRDMKPSNIVLLKKENGDEHVKIVDFGIAKLLPESNKETFHLTQAGQIFGSPLFMSPEQCLNKKVDSRTDIYAIGATMYNALAGRPPFEAPTLAEIIYSHLKEVPEPLSKVAPMAEIPAALDLIVLRCLEKQPGDRFQSMAELKAAIESVCSPKKVVVEKPKKEALINLVIAEDSDALADRLTENIALGGGMAMLARAKSGDDAIDKVMQFMPQAVLIDVKMPGLDGGQVTKQLKACSPNIRVILYTISDDWNALVKSINAGADGYIFQDLSPARIAQAVKSVVNGVAWIDPEITSRVLRQSAHIVGGGRQQLDTTVKQASNGEMDHAAFLDTLAAIYVMEKKYDEAEALYHGAIALHEKARGKESPEIGSTLTKLADLYMSRQKTSAAEHFYMRALQVRFQTLGQEHLDIAQSLENLALLKALG